MILCFIMIITASWGAGDGNVTAYAVETGTFNIDSDALPYTPLEIYEQLFNISNKVEIKLDIPNAELKKLNDDYNRYASRGSKSPIYRKADMYITITTSSDSYTYVINEVGVRMKGNTSRCQFYSDEDGMYNLIHFKVSFKETFDDALYYTDDAHVWGTDAEGKAQRKARKDRTFATLEKIDMKWNKNFDTTYIREYYAYETFRDNGVIAPHTNVASIDIGSIHAGLYTIYEPIDKIFIEKYISAEDQGGNLYKCGYAGNNAPDLTNSDTSNMGVEDEEAGAFYAYDLKTNKKTPDHSGLVKLIKGLNSNSLTKTEFANLVDTDNFLKFSAVSYFTGNPDDFRNNYNNYYIYFLKSSGKAIFIPYDLDRCFGITKDCNPTRDAMTGVSPYSNMTGISGLSSEQRNPLFSKTITKNGLYVTEYTDALESVAASKWLTTAQFNSIYNIVKNKYSDKVHPSKDFKNGAKGWFYFDNEREGDLGDQGNASFSLFLRSIMETYNQAINDIDSYYIMGDFEGWRVDKAYKLQYDKKTGIYSYNLILENSGKLKIHDGNGSSGRWYGRDFVTSYPGNCGLDKNNDEDNNIILLPGTYIITFDAAKEDIKISHLSRKLTAKYTSLKTTCGSIIKTISLGVRKGESDGIAIRYKSSNSNVLKYNESGRAFEAVNTGTAYIIAYVNESNSYNRSELRIKVTVEKGKQTISGVSSATRYGTGTLSLKPKTSGNGRITYSSSNTSIATVSSKGVVKFKKYGDVTITIKASSTSKYAAATKQIKIKIRPKKQVISKLTSTGKKTMNVKWTKDSKASGYQIEYSTKRNFKSSRRITVSSKNTVQKKIKGLISGKSYYVRVKSYVKIGSKVYYGKTSTVKKVKVK